MNYQYNWGVYIGRFQPFHNGHLDTMRFAFEKAENVIIALGSYKTAQSVKNPWTAEEREEMIRACLSSDENSRVFFVYIRDHFYNENRWLNEVQREINRLTQGDRSVTIIGNLKDESSYYVKSFPQWDFMAAGFPNGVLNATDIRNAYFENGWDKIIGKVPEVIEKRLMKFKTSPKFTDKYETLAKEYAFIQEYKKLWSAAPYAPTFVTADCVVVCGGHVLVVRRKGHPGNGQIALPGGFVGPKETIQEAAIRELKEETRIDVSKGTIRNNIEGSRVFDFPDRSLRGRTITHAYLVKLDYNPLPNVKGGDDAAHSWWMPVCEIVDRQAEFFEDHYSIIQSFLHID